MDRKKKKKKKERFVARRDGIPVCVSDPSVRAYSRGRDLLPLPTNGRRLASGERSPPTVAFGCPIGG
ncbi:hypothetical protein NHX12_008747 [Muraenolepis orangiensis]|uniref:Uncharacterized protein n=1 Tax=Muraenolepis orangiensis TaxID=630683 RepID=A0A9Q0I9M5_9TELE|nr:hypothetical protein NHX12_008747 [Muraenolepis orangiensis]